jgi:hypothetical protein
MLSRLALKAFRGLRAVELNDLKRLNLIIGGNNVGKTSILEALVLLYGNHAELSRLPTLFRWGSYRDEGSANFWPLLARDRSFEGFLLESADAKVIAQRDPQSDDGWLLLRSHPLTNQSQPAPILRLDCDDKGCLLAAINDASRSLAIITADCPNAAITTARYRKLLENHSDRCRQLLEILQAALEPRAKALRLLPSASPDSAETLAIEMDTGSALPFSQMGQGFARCFHLLCEILLGESRIVLIDEIESGLYYRSLEPLWSGLLPLLESLDVQIFATTHSLECMQAAARADRSAESDSVSFIRLDRHIQDAEHIHAVVFSADTLQAAADFGEEMR